MRNSRSGLQVVFCIVAACSALGCPLESVRTDGMCAGHCGEFLQASNCGCDAPCEYHGDCCAGYEPICAPDGDEASGGSSACVPAADGTSQTCEMPDRNIGGAIKPPNDTPRIKGLE